MKISIIGAGNMGSALTKQLVTAGHQVRVVARTRDKADAIAMKLPGATGVLPQDAAADADIIIAATGYADSVTALKSLGDLSGKVVVDISNPLSADYMSLTLGHTTSAAEEIAAALPGAIVVKAFNTLFAQVLSAGPDLGDGQKVSVFVASDSERGKQSVTSLAASMGFGVIDAGGLKNARYLEPLGGLNIYFGYGAGLGTAIAPTWLRKS